MLVNPTHGFSEERFISIVGTVHSAVLMTQPPRDKYHGQLNGGHRDRGHSRGGLT